MLVENLAHDVILVLSQLFKDGFESALVALVSEADDGLDDGLDDLSVGAVLLDHETEGLDHDGVLLIVGIGGVQRLALLDEHVHYLKSTDFGLELARVLDQIVDDCNEMGKKVIGAKSFASKVD